MVRRLGFSPKFNSVQPKVENDIYEVNAQVMKHEGFRIDSERSGKDIIKAWRSDHTDANHTTRWSS